MKARIECESDHFSRESEVSNSGLSGLGSDTPSGRSSETNTVGESSLSTGPTSKGSMMSAPSGQQLSIPLTSSAEVFPAKTCLQQERARALLASARACGVSSLVSSGSYSRNGSSLKTCFRARPDGSIPSSASWKSKAMGAFLSRSRRKMSAHRTVADESSLLPTPTASNYGSNKGGAAGRNGRTRLSLNSMATMGAFPTPSASDAKRCALRWATPTVCGNHNRKGASLTSGDGLATQVGGPLNPMWCEWLMGFPIGHTDLGPSAMPSSPSARKSSDGSSANSQEPDTK